MKKKVIIALCVVALGVALFLIWHSQYTIDANQVERIQFGNSPQSRVFSEEETAKFIRLFNFAWYAGEGVGDGGTPEMQVYVYYRDGSYLVVSEFEGRGRDFEVALRDENGKQKAWYYVNSKALQDFILELRKPAAGN